jgi:hypothetical protein
MANKKEPMIGKEDRPASAASAAIDLDTSLSQLKVRDLASLFPEYFKPEVLKPEHFKPEHFKPEHFKPEQLKPEQIKPELLKPEIWKELAKPEDKGDPWEQVIERIADRVAAKLGGRGGPASGR